ncbi:putative secreted RxLR effector protein [Phytophthora cinnamomi]|uniref:putative secreted RxLR effector protein n=1 Tax=Phytophthora cinnamomi TaxID=4785 RepID=UPI002B281A1A|nr:putative secreted RxLR effector protein [Phytophthora cinnamomi]QVE55561.1 RxLR effector protein 60 [Phytophthora cinnamomi]
MRLLSLLGAVALALSSDSASASVISDKVAISKFNADVEAWNRELAGHQAKRSLRRHDNENEERGGVSNVVEKLDDVASDLAIVLRKTPLLPSGMATLALAKIDDAAQKVKAAMTHYPAGLSKSTVQQLVNAERQRLLDIDLKLSKKTAEGMRRPMQEFKGMKKAPILTSHVGRDAQRYADSEKKIREMTVGVVSRSAKEGGGDVLLISSSTPSKREWLLPKGGWDEGESLHKAAWREVIEEGGVNAAFTSSLGTIKAGTTEKGYVYNVFKMKGVTTYDQWAESLRYRIWVSYEDAIKLLENRPDMVEMVKLARAAN